MEIFRWLGRVRWKERRVVESERDRNRFAIRYWVEFEVQSTSFSLPLTFLRSKSKLKLVL